MATTKDFGKFIQHMVDNDPKLKADVEMEQRCMRAVEYWGRRPTASTKHMGEMERFDGISQMLDDLRALAENDGCIAAAWALEVLLEQSAAS